jgi:peptide/nickel transport system substrate-binding protein
LSGESDVDDYVFPYEYDQFKTAEANGKFQLLEPGTGLETTVFSWFNENTNMIKTASRLLTPKKLKWFRNTKFRQAIAPMRLTATASSNPFFRARIPAYGFETPGNKKWFNPNTSKISARCGQGARAVEGNRDRKAQRRRFLTDADGNKIEFVLNTNTGNGARGKVALLIASDLQKLGMKVIFQPIEFNTLITKWTTLTITIAFLWDWPGGADPAGSMNILKSNGFSHEWFPRRKRPRPIGRRGWIN